VRVALLALVFGAVTAPGIAAPRPPALPVACALLSEETVHRALGRAVTALSAAVVGETAAAARAHLANCVYSFRQPPYAVALTLNVAFPSGENAPQATYQSDARGGATLSVSAQRFDFTLWTPDLADRTILNTLMRAVGGATPAPPKQPVRLARRVTREPYACELLRPEDVGRVLGVALAASSATDRLCQYAARTAPYRVMVSLLFEPKSAEPNVVAERIAEDRDAGLTMQAVASLPHGHFVQPPGRRGAWLFFDTKSLLVTLSAPDRADRAALQRLAEFVGKKLTHQAVSSAKSPTAAIVSPLNTSPYRSRKPNEMRSAPASAAVETATYVAIVLAAKTADISARSARP